MAKNTRNTVAKTEIYKLISNSPYALSHTEIQSKLNGLCDRVTIYRVLERLLAENSIHKAITIDGTIKYASCLETCCNVTQTHMHNHAHFSCEICNQLTCMNTIEIPITLPADFSVHNINLTISGICSDCKNSID